MIQGLPYGFWIKGPCEAPRRLVNAAAALAGYAACDSKADLESEAYLSAFVYGEDFRRQLEETGTVRGFEGECWTPYITFDIDRADYLDTALTDARHLAGVILHRYASMDESDLLLYFSGSKGFNVALPTFWIPAPSVAFHRTARHFAEHIARLAGVAIDPAVCVKTQPLRAPNSRHAKTGLHKRRLSFEELMGLSIQRVRQLAKRPEPFELPTPANRCEQAEADWQAAVAAVERQAEVKAERRQSAANGTPRLNLLTLEFIRDGATEGDRHRLLFSAAAKLAEFDCPPALAHALLSDPALDSGLSPSDVRRQIDCGLKHVGPIPESPAPSTAAPPSGSVNADELQAKLAALWSRPPASEEPAPALADEQQADVEDAAAIAPAAPLPMPPAGAKLFFQDAAGRPCAAGEAHIWTWESGPRWFSVAENPIPGTGGKDA